jgi:hypothetical protein
MLQCPPLQVASAAPAATAGWPGCGGSRVLCLLIGPRTLLVVNDVTRIRWLRAVLATAFLTGLFLSPNLWLPGRIYPEAPVWSGLPSLPAWLQRALCGVMLGSLAWIVVGRRPRAATIALAAAAGVLALWDQGRWQPWCFQYLFMLLAIGWAGGPEAAEDRRRAALDACRLVVAGTYFWSGVQKMNFSFADDVFPWMIGPLVPENWSAPPVWIAHVAAAVEMGIGAALLIKPLRNVAVVAAALMHGFILLSIGPFGHNWNTVVWPWNIAMPACAGLLFWRTADVGTRSVLIGPPGGVARLAALALFGILPALSFWGLWDAYLSAALYSGNTLRANLELSEAAARRVPQAVWQQSDPLSDGRREIDLRYWAMDELNVPAYPARRVFRAIAAAAREKWAHAPDDVTLVIFERPDWRTGERAETRE